jgi:hypothetical protein
MQLPKDINENLGARASELAERIFRTYPPLHGIDDPASPLIGHLLRKPFQAQTVASRSFSEHRRIGPRSKHKGL